MAGLSQADRLSQLASRLSVRDQKIVLLLDRLRFVSTGQLAVVLFGDIVGPRTRIRQAQRSVERLSTLGLLHRLDRRLGGVRAGSSGYVCTPTREGLRMAAFLRGEGIPSTAGRVLEPGQHFVDHSLAVSGVFAAVVGADQAGALELLDYQGEPHCWRQTMTRTGLLHLRPDGFYSLGIGETELRWFLEVDMGTEGTRTLRRKLQDYLTYWRSGQEQIEHGVFPRVLWACKHPRRVETLRRLISELAAGERPVFAVCLLDDVAQAIGDHQPGADQ